MDVLLGTALGHRAEIIVQIRFPLSYKKNFPIILLVFDVCKTQRLSAGRSFWSIFGGEREAPWKAVLSESEPYLNHYNASNFPPSGVSFFHSFPFSYIIFAFCFFVGNQRCNQINGYLVPFPLQHQIFPTFWALVIRIIR